MNEVAVPVLSPSARYEHAVGLLSRQHFAQAEVEADALLAMFPTHADVLNLKAAVLAQSGRQAEAIPLWEAVLQDHPDNANALVNLARALRDTQQGARGLPYLERLLELQPHNHDALFNLGMLRGGQDRLQEAQDLYLRALAVRPEDRATLLNLLFIMHLQVPNDPERTAQQAREWGAHLRNAGEIAPLADWLVNADPDRRLRIGLVSGDLRNHPVGIFMEGLLRDPASRAVDWITFDTQYERTLLRARIEPHLAAEHIVDGKSDDEIAALVRDQRIDVLIDLSGHTSGNLLPMFMRRPAPLQLTWLGYFATTGLDCFDGVIADPHCVPQEEAHLFSEPVRYLPHTRMCFTPHVDTPEVALLPALARGHVTFGCFQKQCKLNDAVLALWARIAQAVPTARFRLQNDSYHSEQGRQEMHARMAQAGIAEGRFDLVGTMGMAEYLRAHGEVDILLDTFSYTGGTTTAAGLWMGVPTITLPTPGMMGRQGQSMLMAAGLPQWVARDADDYVRIATEWADPTQWPRLAQLRAGMREEMATQPLFDQARFAREWHALIRALWRERCAIGWAQAGT